MVDPEKVRSAVTQRRETAELVIDLMGDSYDIQYGEGEHGANALAVHMQANSPAAVIALCDGALNLLALAHSLWLFDPDTTEFRAAEYIKDQLAEMFGVSQEGTPDA